MIDGKFIFITGENGLIGSSISRMIQSNIDNGKLFAKLITIEELNNNCSNKIELYYNKNLKHNGSYSNLDYSEFNYLVDSNICCLKEYYDKFIGIKNKLIVIHCGAYVNTDKCEFDPFGAVESNALGTIKIANFCKLVGAKLVYFSTTAVNDPNSYMNSEYLFNETTPIEPKTIYGLSKYIGEMYVEATMSKNNYIIIKPVFVYGRYPEDNSSMITKIMKHCYKNILEDTNNLLDVYLDKDMMKDYFFIDYFTNMVYELIYRLFLDYDKELKFNQFVITRSAPKKFSYYIDIISSLLSKRFEKNVDIYKFLTLYPEKDYLANHIAFSNNFFKTIIDYNIYKNAYDDEACMFETLKSIEVNI